MMLLLSKEDIRKVFTMKDAIEADKRAFRLLAEGKSQEIKELLQKYGAVKLSAVSPEHYPALLKEAKVL